MLIKIKCNDSIFDCECDSFKSNDAWFDISVDPRLFRRFQFNDIDEINDGKNIYKECKVVLCQPNNIGSYLIRGEYQNKIDIKRMNQLRAERSAGISEADFSALFDKLL